MIVEPKFYSEWLSAQDYTRNSDMLSNASVLETLKNFGFENTVSHATVSQIKDNSACFMSLIEDNLIESFKETFCSTCKMKKETKRISEKLIINEDNSDMVCIVDYQVGTSPSKMKEIFCKSVECYLELGDWYKNTVCVGTYCPKHNILIATDWVHNEDTWRFAQNFFRALGIQTRVQKFKKSLSPKELLKLGRFKVVVGLDAEFEIRDEIKNCYVRATSFYDYSGRIGADGSGVELELRPDPSQNTKKVIKNIKRLLENIDIEHKLKFHSNDRPLGSHIHISVWLKSKELYLRSRVPRGLIKMLDTFIGKRLYDITEKYYSRRLRDGYGSLGDWRSTHTHNGFEYRVPPSYIMANPDLTRLTLLIASRTVRAYLENIGNRLEIPDNPSIDDYVKILKIPRKFVEKWFALLNLGPEILNKDVRETWGVKFKIKPFQPRILFFDEWSDSIAHTIYDEVSSVIKKIFSKIDNSKKKELNWWLRNTKIVFFGLKESRGEKWFVELHGLEIDMVNNEELKMFAREKYGVSNLVIGVPRKYRVDKSYLNKCISIVCDIVSKALEEFLND